MILSIGMMVKNEGMYLEKCLGALKPILESIDSELIIVDTGSTDRTVEIAQKFTNKVYFHKWNNNFSEMRNIVLNYCSGEWFFYIDGDEIMESCEDIIHFFKSRQYKNYSTAAIYIKNLTNLEKLDRYSIFTANRLFKKDADFKFLGAIHNQPLWKNPVKYLKAYCLHYGYISTDKELMERKFQRTATILRQELEKDPANIYYMYQLSVSLSMHNDFREATEQIQKTYDYINKENIDITQYFYVLPQLCLCYINEKRYKETEKYAIECLNYKEDYIDALFYWGYSQLMLEKHEGAINSFEKYEKLVENYDSLIKDIATVYYTIGRINDVYYYLYVLHSKFKNNDKAVYYISKIKDNSYDVNKEIVEFSIKNKMYDKLLEYSTKLINEEKYDESEELYLWIESQKLEIDNDENNELTELFSKDSTSYGKLNNIRIKYINRDIDLIESIQDLLLTIKIEEIKDYYGDLLYYLLKYKKDISKIVISVTNGLINDFINYMSIKYSDLCDVIYDYMEIYGDYDDFVSIRINKELCRYAILLNKLEKEKFQEIFSSYLHIGVKYVELVYTPFILENERYQESRNEEEGFFILMRKAKQVEDTDKKLYLKYLRKALDVYPYMKDGVELILEIIKNEDNPSNNEFERYKVQVKNTIKKLINTEELEKAKAIIKEYEEIIKNDMEITLFKSEIAIKQINE